VERWAGSALRITLPSQQHNNAVRIPDPPVRQSGVGRVHAVALGRLGVRKGSYDLIAAVGALDKTVRSRLRVTLAGDGEVDEVRAAVAAAGLHETIHVAGWLDPAARDELLCTAHIFVLPSHDEGMPMALLEAMAYGLAPVTTMVGSIGEAVSDRINGLVVAPGCPGQTAEVLTAPVNDEHCGPASPPPRAAAPATSGSIAGTSGWRGCGPTWRPSSQHFGEHVQQAIRGPSTAKLCA
jgi:glycosyltransferase involved in cell wall biosynthesis